MLSKTSSKGQQPIWDGLFRSSSMIRNLQDFEIKVTTRRLLLALTGLFLSLSLLRVPFFRVTGSTLPCARTTTWNSEEAIQGTQLQQYHQENDNDNGAANHRQRRLGDGCYNIYMDVGANVGIHTRFLFEPDLYPKAKHARALFDGEFGPGRDNRDLCSFGFEPNPVHVTRHQSMVEVYQAMGWRYTFLNAGVSDEEGNLTFYKTVSKHEANHNDWGFSMVKRTEDAIPIDVPVLDLVEWIMEHIASRQLPTKVYGNYTKPKVVMKLDIEGAEFAVLPRLLFSGIMCNVIDVSFGEMHYGDANKMYRNYTDPEEGRGQINIPTARDGYAWYRWMINRGFNSQSLKGCRGRWRAVDDEAYLKDPFPLPNISTTATTS